MANKLGDPILSSTLKCIEAILLAILDEIRNWQRWVNMELIHVCMHDPVLLQRQYANHCFLKREKMYANHETDNNIVR